MSLINLYSRLTGVLATLFKDVIATDFIEAFVAKNKELNNSPNITHRLCDATQLKSYDSETLGCMFSNWLLMYINDIEMKTFANDVLRLVQYSC